jgi:multidrug efflux system membrane fusion protein
MAERRRSFWVFIGLGVVAILLVAAAILLRPKPAKPAPPMVSVNVATVTTQDVPVSLSALGAAQAWRSDTIVAQVSGILQTVNFTEGAAVRAGQVLAQIDPAPYRAALTQAKGSLARDEATLEGAKADLARYKTLAAQDSIARQTYEDEQATVKADEGVVLLDKGAVDAAQVNLDRCRITSPISGRAGVRLVDPGNLVGSGAATTSTNGSGATASTTSGSTAGGASSAAGSSGSVTGGTSGSTGIVVINQITPIAVTFAVPQADFAHLVEVSESFRKPLHVEAFAQETGQSLGAGSLSIADNKVDPSTGTVQLKARFENAGETLWPGQYVNVTLTLQTLEKATTVPAAAINHGPKGDYVYLVTGGKAQMRPVQVTSTQASVAVIKSGVNPGDTVVTDGQMTLRNGSLVRVITPGKPTPGAGAPPPAKS